ncbi:MAG: hypothetical protein CMI12_15650, partial [Oceanospirillum sp.]|nr:hypothetical protein [Oceanospirillum sp.]
MQLNQLCYFLQQRLLGRYLLWGLMVVLLILPYSRAHAVTQVEIIADDNYPPFSYREGFKPAGLYPE